MTRIWIRALVGAAALVGCTQTSTSSSPVDASVPTDAGARADASETVADSSVDAPPVATDASDGAATTCRHCAERLRIPPVLGQSCRDNGPPSSFEKLIAWGTCLCETNAAACASSCASHCQGGGAPTAECLDCAATACPTENAACLADQPPDE